MTENSNIPEERFKQWLAFAKFFLGTFTIAIITAIINHQIQTRELELKELEKLGNYIEHALEEKIGVRRRFSQYFATVTRSDKLRERWKEYNSLVEKEYQIIVEEKKEKEELVKKLQEDNLKGKSVGGELARVRSQIIQLEQEIKVEKQKYTPSQEVTVQAYWHKKGFTSQEAEEFRIKLERDGIPTAVMKHVNPEAPDSIFIGALVNAEDAQLILSSLPYEAKYIFPLTYPRAKGGDPTGLLVGVGYNSAHNKANRNKNNMPIPISKEQFNSLIEIGLSNTEFQLRLRKITSL
ncbi:Uncharacterised protein [Candidatus Venteria ishoeyi]|uniref:Uncharacterized protein n=2 Tax=Candidatus Venteria ishoeyi TaxID=1899563 RepID=A0A1H6F7Z5_9GAMM|nr:Uncharacterised protein [Candidatus Venteria ishoeyi]